MNMIKGNLKHRINSRLFDFIGQERTPFKDFNATLKGEFIVFPAKQHFYSKKENIIFGYLLGSDNHYIFGIQPLLKNDKKIYATVTAPGVLKYKDFFCFAEHDLYKASPNLLAKVVDAQNDTTILVREKKFTDSDLSRFDEMLDDFQQQDFM